MADPPIVLLNLTPFDDDDTIFNVVGGAGRWALFHMMGEWRYVDPNGAEGEVWLWESDQGYGCKEKNVLTDIEKALRIARRFFDTGSYEGLDDVA